MSTSAAPTSQAISTGLGSRLVSNSVDATGFTALPILDLAPILPGSTSTLQERQALALALQAACVDVGFFLVKNHGVEEAVFGEALRQAKAFFDLSLEEKMEVDVKKVESFKGYVPMKGEKVDPDSRGDLHEAFDVGAEDANFAPGHPSVNQWPNESLVPGFKPAIEQTWDSILALGRRLFPLLALALNLDEDHFAPQLTSPGSTMRVLRYPAQNPTNVDLKEIGIGAHTDYEMFTLLKTDEVEALQVLNGKGEWVQVPSLPGHIVVNLGDCMQRMTNGLFKSTMHRVINTTGCERYSIPFFFGLNYDASIACLPGCVSAERPAMYEPMTAGEYVEKRLAETYPTPTGAGAGALESKVEGVPAVRVEEVEVRD